MVSNASESTSEFQLRRYLLGVLPAAETEPLDELSIADTGFAERLRVAEDDLVDDYVAGDLPSDLQEAFRAHYLRTPRGLERVRFARALRDYRSSRARPPAGAVRTSAATLAFGRETLMLAAAAAVLVAVTAGYLLLDNLRLRRELGDAASARVALAERESRLRQRLAEQAAQHPASGPSSAGRVLAFVLAPPTRGIAEPPAFTVPPDARLTLQLTLDADEYPQYSVTVTDPSGAVVARADRVAAQPRAAGKTVDVDIAAGILKAQRYSAELSGLREGRPPDPLSVYPFRIVGP